MMMIRPFETPVDVSTLEISLYNSRVLDLSSSRYLISDYDAAAWLKITLIYQALLLHQTRNASQLQILDLSSIHLEALDEVTGEEWSDSLKRWSVSLTSVLLLHTYQLLPIATTPRWCYDLETVRVQMKLITRLMEWVGSAASLTQIKPFSLQTVICSRLLMAWD